MNNISKYKDKEISLEALKKDKASSDIINPGLHWRTVTKCRPG